MRAWMIGAAALMAVSLSACDDDFFYNDREPDAPRNLEGRYFSGAVQLTWELGPSWDGESFRVYSRRLGDADYFLIADVTNCAANACEYRDVNVVAGQTYHYYVAAVDPDSGIETPTDYSVEVDVPNASPPPVPSGTEAVALDDAVYVVWNDNAANADDFSFYRVYTETNEGDFLLGETDSPGFVDLVAENGVTYSYFVTSVDTQGHESNGGNSAEATPRPDFLGELVYVHEDAPNSSGFRFQTSEDFEAVMAGNNGDRHFRIEADNSGFWFVPGPGTRIYPTGQFTTTLKCGVAADVTCTSWETAPTSGYVTQDVVMDPEFTYMFQVVGDDNQVRYGAVRVAFMGQDQAGAEFVVMDWAYQTQAGNPYLSPAGKALTN